MTRTIRTALAVAWLLGGSTVAAQVRESSGDASITQDGGARTWTMAAGGSALTLAAAAGRDFEILRLTGPADRSWTGGVPDTLVTVDGQALPFGRRSSGFA